MLIRLFDELIFAGELIKMSNPVEEIVGESTMENKQKALNHNDFSSSSTTDDSRRPIDKKKCHLFNRHKPVHSILGGGKCMFSSNSSCPFFEFLI